MLRRGRGHWEHNGFIWPFLSTIFVQVQRRWRSMLGRLPTLHCCEMSLFWNISRGWKRKCFSWFNFIKRWHLNTLRSFVPGARSAVSWMAFQRYQLTLHYEHSAHRYYHRRNCLLYREARSKFLALVFVILRQPHARNCNYFPNGSSWFRYNL